MKTIMFAGFECNVVKKEYAEGGTCLMLTDVDTGDPIAKATIHIHGIHLEDGEVCIKNYSENAGILDALEQNGIVESTGRMIGLQYGEIPVVKLVK